MKPDIRVDDDYEDPSSSDEDYTENEKRLLTKVRQKRKKESDSEEEIYGVRSAEEDSDDEDMKKQISDSDIGEDDDDFPDDRAWGKNKRLYYSTDYVDSDHQGFQAKEVDQAEREAEEASTLQQRDFQYLDDANVVLEVSKSKDGRDEEALREKDDVSKLLEEPAHIVEIETNALIDDYIENMVLARDYLSPIIQRYKAGKLPDSNATHFVITQHELILMYCTNIQMYLYLVASKEDVQNHPVRERILQYKQLLNKLAPNFSEKIKPLIVSLLESEKSEINNSKKHKKSKKKLKILMNVSKQGEEKQAVKSNKRSKAPGPSTATNKLKLDMEEQNDKLQDDVSDSDKEPEPDIDEQDETENDYKEGSKRAITYQMAKNKGLTPYRKKELRNPRVKHRNKFRKALIRRKGAVREPRTEMRRYGGEVSGIKASVSKSIKIKV